MKKLTNEASIPEVIAQMTLEEKLLVLTGSSMFKTTAMEKYGIPEAFLLDGGTGVNFMQMFLDAYNRINNPVPQQAYTQMEPGKRYEAEPSFNTSAFRPKAGDFGLYLSALQNPEEHAHREPEFQQNLRQYQEAMAEYLPDGQLPGCFPPGIVFGASWDTRNIYACGRALGKEANFFKVDVLLGTPNVNIHRDPLNGRLFEGYSEDPFLTAALAPSFVKGIQDEGVIADVKHFAANNQETERRSINEHIPVRALHEIYFPGFKACIQEGECKTVMSAYNAINGEFCAHNRWLLTDVLRDQWGFDGFVVSDWCAAYDPVKAWHAGNDLDMPGPRRLQYTMQAVQEGRLSEKDIDLSLERYLRILLQMPVMTGRNETYIDRDSSREAAYNSVAEALILLKNENHTLPLQKHAKVSFYGNRSKKMIESGGGSANVVTDQTTNVFDCTCDLIGADRVRFEETELDTDAVIITVGITGQEGFDRADLAIDFADRDALRRGIADGKALGKKIIVILNVCGPVEVEDFLEDVDAMLCVFIPGMEGGRVLADALFGKLNPSGKLPITFPKRYKDCPTRGNFPGRGGQVYYGEGIFVGYRYYDYRNIEPRFPFGHGLSYTCFEMKDLVLSASSMDKDRQETLQLRVSVTNTGAVAGKEVVQLYIGQQNPSLVKPVRELKGFQKVHLEPGETKTVIFTIDSELLHSYDEQFQDWITEPGEYTAWIGCSSRDLRLEVPFRVEGYNPCGFNAQTRLDRLVATPGALETVLQFCPADAIDRETVELGVLFSSALPLGAYWERSIAPALATKSCEEREALYQNMLRAINKFH